ncbi:BLUF domain-containing protein [Brevundimonas sp. NPDC046655]|uniref:BLUF domain-containing protein n=1 Tax=unclassified Brevundimonas TaxID=2622653 RepID=UPI00384B80B5
MSFNILTLTGEQIRAARALSRIEQAELARLSGLSLETIKRLERIRGPVEANARTLRAIQDAFAAIGVQFDGDDSGRIGVLRGATEARSRAHAPRQASPEPATDLHRLIYHSRIARKGDESLRPMLAYIHAEAHTLHAGLGVTGIIFAREGHLLQALEGDRATVHQAYRAISCYPQHHDLRLLEDRATTRRQFPEFSFCCGQFASDIKLTAGDPAFMGDFRPEELTPNAAAGLLGVARDLQQLAPRNTRGAPGACPLVSNCMDSTCGGGRRAPEAALAPQAH